jgi:transcriptional regulator with XRE-family HTH domain
MSTGQNIRKYRLELKWTLEKLAEESGVDVGTISAPEQRDSSRSKYFKPIAQAS